MDPNPANPGETPAPPTGTPAAPSPTPAAEPQNPPTPTPPGNEPDINPGEPGAMVPSERLREETEKRRKAEEEVERLKAEQASPAQPQAQPSDDDDELDPDVERMLDGYAKKRGLVSKADIDAERLVDQVKQDVRDLEAQYSTTGIPYNHQEIVKYAQENNLPITSKAALRAAYRDMNWDKLVEAERQRTIASQHSASRSGAELPGGGGPKPPEEPELTGKSPKDRTRERIRLARQKINL